MTFEKTKTRHSSALCERLLSNMLDFLFLISLQTSLASSPSADCSGQASLALCALTNVVRAASNQPARSRDFCVLFPGLRWT
jgi:hypothetical protein